uniref:HIRAN domain-containing protein n=1 Tax=Amphimedon queenslandica TaxID=400682 RepID=A0A1X7SY28_AMPQE
MPQFTIASVVRGHHVFKSIWTPYIDEVLQLEVEDNNPHDQNAVVIKKDDTIVGRVPKEFSKVINNFISSGGIVDCKITGKRKLGKGLEVPCTYVCNGSKEKIAMLRKSIAKIKQL